MAFMGGLGMLAGIAGGFAQEQQRQQQQQETALRMRMQLQQFQQQQQQRQAGAALFRSLTAGPGAGAPPPGPGGAPDLSPLVPLAGPQGAPPGSPDASALMRPIPDPATRRALMPTIAQDESGNRNIPNQQGPGGSPASSASGPYQITAPTWRDNAPAVGAGGSTAMAAPRPAQDAVADRLLATRGLQPWQSNKRLMADVQKVGAQWQSQGVQPPAQPPTPAGFDLYGLAKGLKEANPDMDDETLMMALERAVPIMTALGQKQWEGYKFQTEERDKATTRSDTERRFQTEEQDKAATLAETERFHQQASKQGYQFLNDSDGTPYQMIPGQPATAMTMKGEPYTPVGGAGTGKMGQGGAAPAEAADVKFWTGIIEKGGALPPSLTRGKQGQALQLQIMHQVAADGFEPGQLIAAQGSAQANKTSLVNIQKQADAAKSFERTARLNFDQALKMAPTAVPTNLGPFFNRYIMEGEKMFGDPTVPAYVVKILTGANEYAKIMSGSTGSTGSTVDSRTEAREMFSQYLSLPQISAVVQAAEADMDNRSGSYDEQLQLIRARMWAGMGKPDSGAKPAAASAQPAPDKIINYDAQGNRVGQ